MKQQAFLTDKTLFAKALARLRQDRSDRACASRAGVSLETWQRWERGEERPEDEQIQGILDALEVTATRLDTALLEIMIERMKEHQLPQLKTATEQDVIGDFEHVLKRLSLIEEIFFGVIFDLERLILAAIKNNPTTNDEAPDARMLDSPP